MLKRATLLNPLSHSSRHKNNPHIDLSNDSPVITLSGTLTVENIDWQAIWDEPSDVLGTPDDLAHSLMK